MDRLSTLTSQTRSQCSIISALLILLMFVIYPSYADTLHVTDDTDINFNNLNQNNGGDLRFRVRDVGAGGERSGFIQFDLSALPTDATGSDIEIANLRLWVRTVENEGSVGFHVVKGSWDEESLTAALSPPIDPAFDVRTITNGDAKKFLTVEITSVVRDWLDGAVTNDGIAIVPSGLNDIRVVFDSKENEGTSHPPELEVVLSKHTTNNNTLFVGSDQDSDESDSTVTLGTDGNPIIYILENGNVGIGKADPAGGLSLSNRTFIIEDNTFVTNMEGFEETTAVVGTQQIFSITGGTTQFDDFPLMINSHDAIQLKTVQKGVAPWPNTITRMHISGNGNIGIGTTSPQGLLDVAGPIFQRGTQLHADYVFDSDYELESIEEHAEFMWTNGHLTGIPKAAVDKDGKEVLELGAHRRGIVEELEKSHIYIAQLHERIKRLEEMIGVLEKSYTGEDREPVR